MTFDCIEIPLTFFFYDFVVMFMPSKVHIGLNFQSVILVLYNYAGPKLMALPLGEFKLTWVTYSMTCSYFFVGNTNGLNACSVNYCVMSLYIHLLN